MFAQLLSTTPARHKYVRFFYHTKHMLLIVQTYGIIGFPQFFLYVYDGSKEIAISTRLTIVDVDEPNTAPPEADDSGGGTLSGAYLLLLALLAFRRKSASYTKSNNKTLYAF